MPPIDWPDLAEIPHGCAKPLCRNGFSLLFPAPDQARLVRAFSVGGIPDGAGDPRAGFKGSHSGVLPDLRETSFKIPLIQALKAPGRTGAKLRAWPSRLA